MEKDGKMLASEVLIQLQESGVYSSKATLMISYILDFVKDEDIYLSPQQSRDLITAIINFAKGSDIDFQTGWINIVIMLFTMKK